MKIGFFILLLVSLFTEMSAQTTNKYWDMAINSFQKEDYVMALESLDYLIKKNSNYAPAYYNRAIAKFKLNDLYGACYDIRIAFTIDKKTNWRNVNLVCDDSKKMEVLNKLYYPYDKIYAENGYRPYYTRKDTLRGMLSKERSCYDVTFYDLFVKVFPKQKFITGHNTIYFTVVNNTKRIQVDLFDTYTINKIVWHNMQLMYQREYDAVLINFPDSLIAGQQDSIKIFYEGIPRVAPKPPWDGGFVWSHTKTSKQWIGVACEGLGASSWWPCKDHLSDKPDSMRINLGVPRPYNGVSNGRFIGVMDDGTDYRTFTWFVDYPINNYNATLYIGNFQHIHDTLKTPGFDPIELDYYVLPKDSLKASLYFLQVDTVLNIFQKRFGAYPFTRDGFALVESPFEGMEHQGAIAYGNNFDREHKREMSPTTNFDYIIVHESAHEWWGNSVAASDMADLWLQEGFATYSEMAFAEDLLGHKAYNKEVESKMKMIINVWPMVDNHNVNENSFAGGDIYMKGAIMIHNFRCALNNDSLFNRIIKYYADTFKYQCITSNDFISFVNKSTGRDYSALFHKFMYDRYPPVLEYNYSRSDNNVILTCHWNLVEDGFMMPICLKLDDSTNIRLEITDKVETFTLPNTQSFRFYTLWSDPTMVDWNSFTYFWTSRNEKLKGEVQSKIDLEAREETE
jgi:aminopeptidase N